MSAPTPAYPSEPAGGPPLVRHEPPLALGRRLLVVPAIVTGLVVLTMIVLGGAAQGRAGLALEQCAQLDAPCDDPNPAQWVNGNLNSNNSLYVEGDAVPYRALLTGLAIGETYALTIGWDTVEGGRHVIDQLVAHDLSEAAADPCAGLGCGSLDDVLALPADPQVVAAGVTPVADRRMSIAGGSFVAAGSVIPNIGNLCAESSCAIDANPSPYSPSGDFDDTAQNSITVWLTASAEDAVVTWGGHIATRADWGAEGSAAAVSGSPYHMRLLDFRCSDATNCSSGNMDRSLSADAVVYPGAIEVRKTVADGGTGTFEFTGGPAPVTDVTIVVPDQSGASHIFDGLFDAGPYTISEVVPSGWDQPDVDCETAGANGGSTSIDGSSVEVTLGEGESVVCTFVNTPPSTTTTTSTSSTSTSSTSSVPTSTSTTTTTSVASTSTIVAAAVTTTTVYVDAIPTPIGSILVVPQPVTPGRPVVAAQIDASPSTTTTVAGTVVASSTGTLPVSGGSSALTILAGLGLSAAGALLTRRHTQEDE